jgi:hypothetical protein
LDLKHEGGPDQHNETPSQKSVCGVGKLGL